MTVKNKRIHSLSCVLAGLVCLQSSLTMAETVDQRIERLEKEISDLRQMLHDQKQTRTTPPASESVAPAPVNNVKSVAQRSGVNIRYYISQDKLGEYPQDDAVPAVQGRFADTGMLSFDPAKYDLPKSGLFSSYRDPSDYRYVGLMVEGDLAVSNSGEYEFILHPKPARVGGNNIATRMSVWLRVNDKPVVEFRDQSSWRARRGRVHLDPGMHRVQIWATVESDGFGPSPTASNLLLALKAPGDASPLPMRDLYPID